MAKPDDIPQSVYDTAEAVLKQIVYERVAIDGESEVTIGGIDLIARAIMAEREACAAVADQNMNHGPLDAAAAIRKRGETK